jgi:hypothetical protein
LSTSIRRTRPRGTDRTLSASLVCSQTKSNPTARTQKLSHPVTQNFFGRGHGFSLIGVHRGRLTYKSQRCGHISKSHHQTTLTSVNTCNNLQHSTCNRIYSNSSTTSHSHSLSCSNINSPHTTCRNLPPPSHPALAKRLAGTKNQTIATYQVRNQNATNGWDISTFLSGFSSLFAPACVASATR